MFHSDSNIFADFRLPLWLIIDVNYDLGLIKGENMGDFVDVPGVYATSIFRVEVCRVVTFYVLRAWTK
jgi:hypothetical protein